MGNDDPLFEASVILGIRTETGDVRVAVEPAEVPEMEEIDDGEMVTFDLPDEVNERLLKSINEALTEDSGSDFRVDEELY